jgi:hypothetical protein
MKKIFSLFTVLLLVSNIQGQTLTIEVFDVKTHVGFGDLDLHNVYENPDYEENQRTVNCRYVFNLSEGTSTFYRDNKFVSEIKITSQEIHPGVYTIDGSDTDLQTGNLPIKTQLFLDINQGSEKFLYRYFDPFRNKTEVDVMTHFQVVRPS